MRIIHGSVAKCLCALMRGPRIATAIKREFWPKLSRKGQILVYVCHILSTFFFSFSQSQQRIKLGHGNTRSDRSFWHPHIFPHKMCDAGSTSKLRPYMKCSQCYIPYRHYQMIFSHSPTDRSIVSTELP